MYPTTEVRLRSYADILLRHKTAIAVMTLLTVLVGLGPTLIAPKIYDSTASIRIRAESVTSPFEESSAEEGVATRSRDLLTDVEVLNSTPMRARVVEALGDEAEEFDDVHAELVGFSEIIDITVTAHTPEAAADAADTYADLYVQDTKRRSVESLIAQAEELRTRAADATDEIAVIDARLAEPGIDPVLAESLRNSKIGLGSQAFEYTSRADELEVEAALREDRIEVVSYGELNLTPVAPKPTRAAITSIVIGLLVGIGTAIVLDIVRDRLSSADDLAAIDPVVPTLAAVPHMADAEGRFDGQPNAVVEAYRYLYTSLRFRDADEPLKSMLVTSSLSAEGKTTTALNLATVASEAGARVVFIDADLRRPAVHERLCLSNDVGLTEVLEGSASASDAVQFVTPTLAVLTAGAASPIANELLGTSRFAELVAGVSAQSDLVIIDVPPVLPVADPVVAGRAVDGILLVTRIEMVKRREIRSVLRRLRQAQLSVVGFVANDSSATDTYGDYESLATQS